ncbi:MAG TPA: hypothetical protein ENN91_02650, partial [Firmicutes bacterium]|nr:hypothetical protein [Bacillota bacterium]
GLMVAGCGDGDVAEEPTEEEPVGEEPTEEEPAGDPIVWEGACGWPEGNLHREQAQLFADLLAENTNGELTINLVGPETFPGPEQIQLIYDGTLDFVATVTAYYMQDMPEGGLVYYCWGSREEREAAGLYAYLDELHREQYNCTVLAEAAAGTMHVFMKEPIEAIEDFAGKRFRSPPAYMAGLEDMGATTMFMGDADTIDALQSGVIDGAITSMITYDSWQYFELTPYVIYPAMAFNATTFFANLDSIDALPDHLKDALYETLEEAQEPMDQLAIGQLQDIYASSEEKGVVDVNFASEEEAEEYYALWFDTYIEQVVRPLRGDEVAEKIIAIHDQLNYPPKGRISGTWQSAN